MINTAILPPDPYQTKFQELGMLEIGQSTTYPIVNYASVASSVTYLQRRYEKRFTRRTEGDVVRVWRIA
jgi:hypothetical protein